MGILFNNKHVSCILPGCRACVQMHKRAMQGSIPTRNFSTDFGLSPVEIVDVVATRFTGAFISGINTDREYKRIVVFCAFREIANMCCAIRAAVPGITLEVDWKASTITVVYPDGLSALRTTATPAPNVVGCKPVAVSGSEKRCRGCSRYVISRCVGWAVVFVLLVSVARSYLV